MKTIAEIRRANLEVLVRQFGTLDALAEKANTSSVYLSQIRNRTVDIKTGRPREMGTGMAGRLCAAAGKAPGWMDSDQSGGHQPRPVAPEAREPEQEGDAQEQRLLAAFRQMLKSDREKYVAQMEARAEEVLAIADELRGTDARMSRAKPGAASRKPKRAA